MRRLGILLLGSSLLTACGAGTDGDYYFVRSGDAERRQHLRRAMSNPGRPAFNELEQRYAVVYWDQRGSGTSQGDVDPSTLSMEQFIEDTDRVLETLAMRYSPRSIFLVGHSWGGSLGSA
ncbi:MAG: alpha/beta fold hydrolase [Myxococcaceae bacterium]